MAKYIAHSSIDERGKAAGGQAGDQTGKEVCIRTWYDMSATQLFRIENKEVRELFANNMIDCANNNNIGYDQNQRNTILTQAEKVDFDFSKINVKCESDCSSTITACFLGAIYKVLGKEAYQKAKAVLVQGGNCATTSTMKTRLQNNGVVKVTLYTATEYTRGTSKAVFGDIYNKPGSHVVCYIDDGKKVVAKNTTTNKSLEAWAKEVIAGKHGSGHANREASLKKAGCTYAYSEVRAKVNELCSTKQTSAYYPKYTGSSNGIDTVLRAVGVPESHLGNWKNRRTLASKNNIKNYEGTSKQNLELIALAKNGKLKKV